MQSLETRCALRACPRLGNGRGQGPAAARLYSSSRIKCVSGQKAPHPVNEGCGSLGEASGRENWGCGQCPHFGPRIG